jgi:hypothetical protein
MKTATEAAPTKIINDPMMVRRWEIVRGVLSRSELLGARKEFWRRGEVMIHAFEVG